MSHHETTVETHAIIKRLSEKLDIMPEEAEIDVLRKNTITCNHFIFILQ